MLEYTDYIKIFIALLAVVDPIGVMPIIAGVVAGGNRAQLNSIAGTAALTVATILLISLFIGEDLLYFFGISINSFKISGGILLMLMALSMLSIGISLSRAFCMAKRSRKLASGLLPPWRTATIISRESLVKSEPRLASASPLVCLIFAHLECPDMASLLRRHGKSVIILSPKRVKVKDKQKYLFVFTGSFSLYFGIKETNGIGLRG